jgi:hypothetical protein
VAARTIRFAIALAALLAAAPAFAEALRPEVGKPLQAAQGAIKQQKYRDALARIKEAEAAGPLSPRESALLEQLRGIAASGAGDNLAAARAFEAAIASGHLAPADQAHLTQAVGSLYYQARDYSKATAWLRRIVDAGSGDEATKTLLAQAYYLSEDYANAARALRDQVSGAEQAGRTPSEAHLQLLANAELKRDNPDGYGAALEKLAAHYPKADYWVALLQRVQARPGFAGRLSLDALRLARAVGTLSTAAQYTEAAELALQGGLPAEAKAFLDQGFAAGILGTGPDAERHKRLRALADQKAAADLKALAQGEGEAADARDGTGLVNTGLAYVGLGQPAKGARLIEQGIAKGGLKQPDDARLRLGYAYLSAGARDKAAQAFKAVQGKDGAQELARLWLIHLGGRG